MVDLGIPLFPILALSSRAQLYSLALLPYSIAIVYFLDFLDADLVRCALRVSLGLTAF